MTKQDHSYEQGKKKSDLEKYLNDSDKVNKAIFTNLERGAELIRSFKKIAVDQSIEEWRYFKLGEYMHDVLMSLKPQLTEESLVEKDVTNIDINKLINTFC